jgi:hypothetical protein
MVVRRHFNAVCDEVFGGEVFGGRVFGGGVRWKSVRWRSSVDSIVAGVPRFFGVIAQIVW